MALENESAGSSWLFSRAPNSGDLVIINEKSGEFLQSGDGDSLTTSEELDPSKGGWTFQSEQEKLAAAIASALAAHGGVGLVQHGWSQVDFPSEIKKKVFLIFSSFRLMLIMILVCLKSLAKRQNGVLLRTKMEHFPFKVIRQDNI